MKSNCFRAAWCRFRGLLFTGSSAVVLLASLLDVPVSAQLPTCRLYTISPAGGTQGSTVEVVVGGADMEEARALYFSHPGIKAVAKKKAGAASLRPDLQREPNRFIVTIGKDVPTGVHDVRVAGLFGLSNPRSFHVSNLPDVTEAEGNNTAAEAKPVSLNSTINGVTNGAADVDCFKFRAKKGQRVLVDCFAYRLESRFEGVLSIHTAAGAELRRSAFRYRRDPFLDVRIPADGDYILRVTDVLYRGGGEYFYRLVLTTQAHIDFVWPPAVVPGAKASLQVFGRNLPGGKAANVKIDGNPIDVVKVDFEAPKEVVSRSPVVGGIRFAAEFIVDSIAFRLPTPDGPSGPYLLSAATAPVVLEAEPNNARGKPQRVKVPCEVAGQFYPSEDQDWFEFEAKKGEVYWIEVFSHRLGFVTDPRLIVEQVVNPGKKDESFKSIATNDDMGGNLGGKNVNTASDDSAYRLAVPADGVYRVMVVDLYGNADADPRYVYRLALRKETPDFRLAAVPVDPSPNKDQYQVWSAHLRQGGTDSYQILVSRRDGFNGPIGVRAEGLPAGVSAVPLEIPAGRSEGRLLFMAEEGALEWIGAIKIIGSATVGDRRVQRVARGATRRWAGKLAPGRMMSDVVLAVTAGEKPPFSVVLNNRQPIEVPRGGKVSLPVKLARRIGKADITVSAAQLPADVSAKNLALKGDATEGKIEIALKPSVRAGAYPIAFRGSGQIQYRRNLVGLERETKWKKEVDQRVAEITKQSTQAEAEKKSAVAAATQKEAAAKAAQAAYEKTKTEIEAAKKSAEAAVAKANQARGAHAQKPEDENLKAAKAAAEKTEAEAKKQMNAAAEAEKRAAEAAKKATAEVEEAAKKKGEAEKKAAEAAAKLKAAKTEQAAADKRVKDATNAAKPKKLNAVVYSKAIELRVVEMPAKLKLTGPVEIAIGEKIEVPVKLERLAGFQDSVELHSTVPDEIAGVKVAKLVVAKGKSEGKLVIETSTEAKLGEFPLTLKATAKYAGQDRASTQILPVRIVLARVAPAAKAPQAENTAKPAAKPAAKNEKKSK